MNTSHTKTECLLCAEQDLDWLEKALVGKAKKRPSILTETGLIQALLREARLLKKEVRRSLTSEELKSALLSNTAIDWLGATASEKTRAITALGNLIEGLPSEFAPGVLTVLNEEGKRVVDKTHRANAKKYKSFPLDVGFALKNEDAVQALATSTSVFFKEEYERQGTRFRQRAQETLAKGTEEGLGSREIGEELRREFRDLGLNENYWDTVAAIHTNRARTFSSLKSYAEGGVTAYEVVAVGDERTTEICNMMNGEILQVESALNAYDSFEEAEDLEDLKTNVAPLMRHRGRDIVTQSGQRIATRTKDGWDRVKPGTMNARGINGPPYHHRCRTTVVPVFD